MFTVAHELGHLYLGHVEPSAHRIPAEDFDASLPGKREADADRLAVSWGFALPEWRRKNEDET